MPKQYVQVRLRPGGTQYVYEFEGDDIQVGSHVEVDGMHGPLIRPVEVVTTFRPPALGDHIVLKPCRKV